MQLHDLYPAEGSRKDRKRVGRGNSGYGGTTAGRGQKGQKSRSGGGKGPGHEGGQMKLAMRLPKLNGFNNKWRVEYLGVNISRINDLFNDGDVVDADALVAKNVIKNVCTPVKILGDGELTKKLTVKVDKCSASAQAKIEAAGGTVELPC
ncbi:MAG: 50S ribosomal protein L15 [Coriobacteriales bacterium]|nr:50S ribosomal protein L15 [Coriobacteriales bacterium]